MRRARGRNGHDSEVQGRRSLTVRPAHIPRDVTGAGGGGGIESLLWKTSISVHPEQLKM